MITIRNDDFPDIERDMKIIANKRLDILKDAGLADPKSKGADIGPFLSPPPRVPPVWRQLHHDVRA